MKINYFLIVVLLFSINIFAQNSWKTSSNQKDVNKNWMTSFNHNSNYFFYTPITDTAINITYNSATIIGTNERVRSNKNDTLATKKAVQNYMVYGYGDTTQQLISNGTFSTSTGWNLGSNWSISSGLLTRVSSGLPNSIASTMDLDTLIQNGIDRYKYSFELSNYTAGTLYLFIGGVINSFTGNGTKTGYFTRTGFASVPLIQFYTYDGFAGSIDNFELYHSADSTQGKIVLLTGLIPGITYNYKHSILINSNDGDIDYYEGVTKSFTPLDTDSFPAGIYLTSENGKFWTTTQDKFITIGE